MDKDTPGTLEERALAVAAKASKSHGDGRSLDFQLAYAAALAALTEAADEIASLRARVEAMDIFVKRVALDPKWTLAASEVLMRPDA